MAAIPKEKLLRIENDVPTLYIYGDIGEKYFFRRSTQFVCAKDVIEVLEDIEGPELLVKIYSTGGDTEEGFAIYEAIEKVKEKVKTVSVEITGEAHSMASVIAMAGHKIRMRKFASMELHRPKGRVVWGLAEQFSRQATKLKEYEDRMIEIYGKRLKKSKADIKSVLDKVTWFTADQALEHGLADEVFGTMRFNDPDKPKRPGLFDNLDLNRTVGAPDPKEINEYVVPSIIEVEENSDKSWSAWIPDTAADRVEDKHHGATKDEAINRAIASFLRETAYFIELANPEYKPTRLSFDLTEK